MRYVVGFLIDRDRGEVALVEKQRPEWQAGKFNGVGGKIEPGESAYDAMCREFIEEAGYGETRWNPFCIYGDGWEVHYFRAWAQSYLPASVRTMTDERVVVFQIDHIPWERCVPNLRWLIPMAQLDQNYAIIELGVVLA